MYEKRHALSTGLGAIGTLALLLWSRSASRLTGWPADAVVGRTCSDNILVHIDKDGHRLCGEEHCPLHRAIVTGTVSPEPLLVFAQHKQGHRSPVEVSVAPIRDGNGNVVGGIEVFRDLTVVMEDLRRARPIPLRVCGLTPRGGPATRCPPAALT